MTNAGSLISYIYSSLQREKEVVDDLGKTGRNGVDKCMGYFRLIERLVGGEVFTTLFKHITSLLVI